MSHRKPEIIDAKELTDNEYQCLMALVDEYGAGLILALVADMAAQQYLDREQEDKQ